jgi:hypothetical protein
VGMTTDQLALLLAVAAIVLSVLALAGVQIN